MTAMPEYLAPWSTLRADDGGVIAYVHPRALLDYRDSRITIGPAPDPGQRYRLTEEATAAVAYAAMQQNGQQPYLRLLPDGVTLDLRQASGVLDGGDDDGRLRR